MITLGRDQGAAQMSCGVGGWMDGVGAQHYGHHVDFLAFWADQHSSFRFYQEPNTNIKQTSSVTLLEDCYGIDDYLSFNQIRCGTGPFFFKLSCVCFMSS
jgi:hypothetical protein